MVLGGTVTVGGMGRRNTKQAQRAAKRARKTAVRQFMQEEVQPQWDWINRRRAELIAEGFPPDDAHHQAQSELPYSLKVQRPSVSVFKDMTLPETIDWGYELMKMEGRSPDAGEAMLRVNNQIYLEIELVKIYDTMVETGVIVPLHGHP